jgi:hypothetical protein
MSSLVIIVKVKESKVSLGKTSKASEISKTRQVSYVR